MKVLQKICRLLLGALFIFSGFVKGIDPLGSGYKFTDYFNAWGMEFLIPIAIPLGVLLSLAEFGIGVALVLNIWKRLTAWAALIFMSFFFVLTLIIAIKNPVTDCGCFGDAIKLTNWQTFYKNILLLAMALVVFMGRDESKADSRDSRTRVIVGLAIAAIYLGLVYYSYQHLPIIDFRPYKVGNNINDGMRTPKGAPTDVYENTFIYKNKSTGKEQEFTEDNYPWQDTLNWEYVDMQSKLIQEGYTPPIKDFNILTPDGEDIKDFFLLDDYCTFMLIINPVADADWSKSEELKQLIAYCDERQMSFIGLTASNLEDANKLAHNHGLKMEFFTTDEITLKTIIRSNPGLMLTRKGDILGKWNVNDIPSPEMIDELLDKE